jgi:predicted enzyme related to lactoylglutathione lyase
MIRPLASMTEQSAPDRRFVGNPAEESPRMLAAKDAVATIAVTDLDRAKAFYGEVLGLEAEDGEMPEQVASFRSGGSSIIVYRSDYAGTNQATAVTWTVDNVDTEVEALKSKGVTFEHYNMPQVKLEGDVHVAGSIRNAWFKDPDCNILSIVSVN